MGAQVPVSSSAVEVVTRLSDTGATPATPGHDTMDLATVFPLNNRPSQATVRTREKIGLGMHSTKLSHFSMYTAKYFCSYFAHELHQF